MISELSKEDKRAFVNALMQIPVTMLFVGRTSLLNGMPKVEINRSENNRRLDLDLVVNQYAALGRDKNTGIRPLVILAENALDNIGDWEGDLYDSFNEIIRRLNDFYAGEPQPAFDLPDFEPEMLLFDGRDERVSIRYIQRALVVSKSIGRFMVPRYFNGVDSEENSFGTGWLIAPGIMLTNHHVIDARDRRYEAPAAFEDFCLQAENTTVWFDYFIENGSYLQCDKATLLASDETLDYAIIRLEESDKVTDRPPLPIIEQPPQIVRGHRLNIVQHSGGGPLTYAIRNNYFMGHGESDHFLLYLTDTERGASGSPIFNDFWKVVGVHHVAKRIPPEFYVALPQQNIKALPEEVTSGDVVSFHNQGIAIHAILDHLDSELSNEIKKAQGWLQ